MQAVLSFDVLTGAKRLLLTAAGSRYTTCARAGRSLLPQADAEAASGRSVICPQRPKMKTPKTL
jgi:hypothetical protein